VQFGIGSVTHLRATSCAKHHNLLKLENTVLY
jgi:hypothetical protein